jgi:N-acetylneuraminic acid mutarotase
MTHSPGQVVTEKNTYGKVADRRPAARDGHSGIIHEEKFIVFGGDRHHMPFNDFHYLNIEKEFE